MYGPKSGSLIASIPGLPLGFPGPGFPTPPVPPPPEPLASFEPEPPVGASEGPAEYLPAPPFVEVPPFAEVPEPLIGPVVYLPVPVPPFGTGIANGDEGFIAGLGVVGGFIDGRAVGGAGFAC